MALYSSPVNKPPFLAITLFFATRLSAQPYNPTIDVQHYEFSLQLTDSNNVIRGVAAVTLQFNKNASEFRLDLTKKTTEGKGMTVTAVHEGNSPLPFTQEAEHLVIHST